ncbi:hypothetical protein CNMCM8980_009723 [Aspergillus fumigatiaffinis]|uniref:Uncharacterized protein n=1 Tax=Aspergillus fumigatiaffinis TaxID=340414 RepID=A0A8H4GY06_9EURO|nr:hypothetical protein CNMCM5878_010241 [Aspergillus fumigatiaffinis]KAF4225090.1 hypothetical protein CNMCM6457_008659 [Aspergillus fumigatiaffinis]KAF4231127.1 hypothetical protein CNMCM6805_000291 [Aspergillus fumigatiaffinis]KAF4245242.1 hypothetical protein CNMCM8980_009723 [Aspergillus fumigatiaffinis]
MYQSADSLSLDYTNQQLLPRRYESDEEEISESEHGGHDNAFSPVDDTTGTFSDMSTEELSRGVEPEPENRQVARLLAPYPSRGRKSRPVSIDTVKRSSNATFATDSIVYDDDDDDDDDDVIIELPPPDQMSPLQSPIFLQPTVYVPPGSPGSSAARSMRSPSPTSVFSVEETDVLVAEQVTYVEPISKPHLIQISTEQSYFPPVASADEKQDTFCKHSSSNASDEDACKGIYSLRQAAKSQPLLSTGESDGANAKQLKRNSVSVAGRSSGSARESKRIEVPKSSATMQSLSEVPEIPQPLSPRSRSRTFSGTRASPAQKLPSLYTAVRSRLPAESLRRPPSLRSLSSASVLLPHARHASTSAGLDTRTASTFASHTRVSSEQSSPLQTCRTPSPILQSSTPYYSSPTFCRERSGSVYSNSSAPTPTSYRPPPPVRNSTMHSFKSSYSSSLRSEVESLHSVEAPEPVGQAGKSTMSRKKSLKRSKLSKQEGKEQSTAKSIMGFMMRGRRKSSIWNHRS